MQIFILGKIKSVILNRFRAMERVKRVEAAKRIPVIELEEKHILETQLITNRSRLLELMPENGVWAEIGVNRGEFSREIIEKAKPEKLHLIDAWASERYHQGLRELVEQLFAAEIGTGVVEINQGYSTDVLKVFPDHYFDCVYIDTAHTYDVTRDELAILENKMKPGGLICGHDYINSCWRNAVKYGVVEAVHEFCVLHDWRIVYLTNETHQHRSFCLSRIR